ncbi:hypothetical protein CUJ89_31055 [Burkholderia pyrrocinia]|uniref:Uncharacterized protein n=1 Tax=Burkholderia pyrrocinia TaxID=60550 RepID=A0A2Z5N756_BURPY|nr:hypothetical protein CUJ89_31055 [Burkholderia pyrrocinia]
MSVTARIALMPSPRMLDALRRGYAVMVGMIFCGYPLWPMRKLPEGMLAEAYAAVDLQNSV